MGTFTYGTGSSKWKRRSDWVLPFIGPAHYDIDLDAWVGLHRADARDDDGSETTDGHLCACRVMSAASASRQPPEWKVSGETLFREDLGHRRGKVQLVYMGRRSEYCLVEHLRACDDERESYVLRLTVFRARYGEDGELTTTVDRPARSYEVPGDYDRCFDAQAFWM